MTLTWRPIKTYQLGRPICNPWSQCCYNNILLFWWNSQCRIKINPKPNLRLYFLLLFHFISFHFSLLLLNFCSCFWTMKGVSIFFYFRYGHEKHKLQKSCVYAQPWVI
jgi:hypothetical protein